MLSCIRRTAMLGSLALMFSVQALALTADETTDESPQTETVNPAVIESAAAKVVVKLIDTPTKLELANGFIIEVIPRKSGASVSKDYGFPVRMGRPVRGPRLTSGWVELEGQADHTALSTDRLLGSRDYLDSSVSQIRWDHFNGDGTSAATNHIHMVLTRNGSLNGVSCPIDYFSYAAPFSSTLWCFSPGSDLLTGMGYQHLKPGAAFYESIITKDYVPYKRTYNYTIRPGTIEYVSGEGQTAVVGATTKDPLVVKLKDADGVPVQMPIDNSSEGFRALIEAPRNAVGMKVMPEGSSYLDATGSVRYRFTAGDKAGLYRVRFTHPDAAATDEVVIDVTVKDRVKPDDDEENEEDVGDKEKTDCKGAAGDPISLATGNVYHIENDYQRVGLSPLEFSRTYNSQGSKSRLTDTLWSTSYDRFVMLPASSSAPVRLRRPDGQTIRFAPMADGSYAPQPHFREALIKTATGWRLVDGGGTVETFDAAGKLLTIADLTGRVQTAAYNRDGLLETITANTGESLSFRYDGNKQLFTVTDHSTRVWTYSYDKWSNLIMVAGPDGRYRHYRYGYVIGGYGLPYALHEASISNSTSRTPFAQLQWRYDAQGRGISSFLSGNTLTGLNQFDITYREDGSRSLLDSNGNRTEYTMQAGNNTKRVSSVHGPEYATCGVGDLDRVMDANFNILSNTTFGRITAFLGHDLKGQHATRVEAAGTPLARTTEYTYDARFVDHPTKITAPSVKAGGRRITNIIYNAQGLPTSIAESGFRPDGGAIARSTTLAYAGPFAQLSSIDGPRTDVADITTLSYDLTSKRLKAVTGATGVALRSNLVWTKTGLLQSEDRPNGLRLSYAYEPGSERLATLTETAGGRTHTTRWTYDARSGLVTSIRFSDGINLEHQMSFGYDAADRLIQLDSGNDRIVYTLSRMGEVLRDEKSNGAAVKHWIQRTFDAYSRIEGVMQANAILDYDHHPDGTLSSMGDGRNQTTTYTYDELKRLSRVVQPGSTTTQYAYDVADRLVQVTDPIAGETRYGIDDFGNAVWLQSPDTGGSSATYDAAGNLRSSIDAKAQTTTFSYDAANRLTAIDSFGTEDDETRTWDSCLNGSGRLCKITSSNGELLSFEYDGFGRVSKLDSNGSVLRYDWDVRGNLTKLTYPSGRIVNYVRDAGGRVTRVDLSFGGSTVALASAVAHLPFGPNSGWTYGNGQTASRSFDQQYWPRSFTAPGAALNFSTYDGNGNLKESTFNGASQSFDYDLMDRLTTASGSFGNRSYGYDGNGNRMSRTADAVNTGYTYESRSNRLLSETGSTYSRDANGNTLEKRAADGSVTGYRYTTHNRLKSVYALGAPAVDLASYRYNGLGQRSQKATPTRTTRYLYGLSPQLLAEVEGGGIVREYVYLDGEPLALLGPPGVTGPPPSFDEIKDNSGAGRDWVSKLDNKAVGGSYLYLDQAAQSRSNTHAWFWTVPVAGKYQVQVFWVAPNNSGITEQTYKVQPIVLNSFTINGSGVTRGSWVNGPTVTLGAGSFGVYLMEDQNPAKNLFADAVRLKLIEATPAAPDFVHFVHTDHLGTPRSVTDKNGRVVWTATYDPFGAAAVTEDPDADGSRLTFNLRAPGQYYDPESGLHYNYFRDYDPGTGRYIESDPMGLAGGVNTFSYVDGNPIMGYDPDGLIKRFDKWWGLSKKFQKWAHKHGMDIDDLSEEEARDLAKEWKRLGKPSPDNANKRDRRFDEEGFVDPEMLLDLLGPVGLLLSPSELACSDLDCNGDGIPDYEELELSNSQRKQSCK